MLVVSTARKMVMLWSFRAILKGLTQELYAFSVWGPLVMIGYIIQSALNIAK